jgi:hypothetical protein
MGGVLGIRYLRHPTVAAATPVKMVAARIELLGLGLLLAASISCSRHSC